jgi:RNA polymerase sigma-70 factor (ECF subfamily)
MTRERSGLTVALVQRALAKDKDAVRVIVDVLTPVIQARAARALLRRGPREVRADVEDITQTVLAGLFADNGRVLRQWDPERGLSLEGLVRLRTEHEVASMLRTRRRSPLTHTPTPIEELDVLLGGGAVEAGPELDAASRELLVALVTRIRERLSEQGREVFEMLVVEELPVEDVSALTDLSANAIYQWRARLERLARHIAAELVSESDESQRKHANGRPMR